METCMEKIKTASKRPEEDQNLLVSSLQSSNGSVAVQRRGRQQQCDQREGYSRRQRVEKASQSFAPAGAKEMQIMFPGGVYVGKHTLRPASVQAVRLLQPLAATSRGDRFDGALAMAAGALRKNDWLY